MKDARDRLKNAELLSLTGACFAAGGIALFLHDWLGPYRLPLLLGGLVVHAAAMFHRRRLERTSGNVPSRWERWLYWSCWFILAMLSAYILAVGLEWLPASSQSSSANLLH